MIRELVSHRDSVFHPSPAAVVIAANSPSRQDTLLLPCASGALSSVHGVFEVVVLESLLRDHLLM
jgi:hypothetical protein